MHNIMVMSDVNIIPGMQVRHLINALNEATEHIPGWNEYSATGKITQIWDGNL